MVATKSYELLTRNTGIRRCLIALNCLATFVAASLPIFAAELATLHIQVRDDLGDLLPCRIHLVDEAGDVVRAESLPFWHDHFVCDGEVTLNLALGKYRFAIERGPEYQRCQGEFNLDAQPEAEFVFTLSRLTHLRDDGWYSGDLHVHRPLSDVPQLMRAEDLDFAPVITWWNDRNLWSQGDLPDQIIRRFDGHRIINVMAGEDEREGGALLYFGLPRPLPLAGSRREVPSPMEFVRQAQAEQPAVWIDIEKPFWWDVPVWLALAGAQSMGIANNHMCRSSMYPSEAWGRPRDAQRLPAPRGNGFWSQEIYYHALNAGLRIPPSAGSASGVLPNPVGYNRVYVHLEEPFTVDSWFRGLSAGRCFVTNGPLLTVTANHRLPGSSLVRDGTPPAPIVLEISLTSSDPVPQLEVVHNGRVVRTIPCSRELHQQHVVELELAEPGWFLVRAVADVESTFRFASTGPWWLETSSQPTTIQRDSVQFFLDWVDERTARVEAATRDDDHATEVLRWHRKAHAYWMQRLP